MNARFPHHTVPPWGLCLFAIVMASPVAAAAPAAAQADARSAPARTRVVCTTVRGDARDNCLSEASTLLASTRPSRPEENAEQLARNALRRCEPLHEPDRPDCVMRIQGRGTTTGSVAEGGIYRELVTREVGVEAVAQPTVAPAAPVAAPAAAEGAR